MQYDLAMNFFQIGETSQQYGLQPATCLWKK